MALRSIIMPHHPKKPFIVRSKSMAAGKVTSCSITCVLDRKKWLLTYVAAANGCKGRGKTVAAAIKDLRKQLKGK